MNRIGLCTVGKETRKEIYGSQCIITGVLQCWNVSAIMLTLVKCYLPRFSKHYCFPLYNFQVLWWRYFETVDTLFLLNFAHWFCYHWIFLENKVLWHSNNNFLFLLFITHFLIEIILRGIVFNLLFIHSVIWLQHYGFMDF